MGLFQLSLFEWRNSNLKICTNKIISSYHCAMLSHFRIYESNKGFMFKTEKILSLSTLPIGITRDSCKIYMK